VAAGCPHNSCAFCGAYRGERHRITDESTVFEDIDFAARHMGHLRRVFLCGGDAMALPWERLARILRRIRERLPRVARTSVYASASSIAGKSHDELGELAALGLSTLYMGLESGDGELLRAMGKHAGPEDMLREARKVRQAGLKLSVSLIVGLAGSAESGGRGGLDGLDKSGAWDGWQRHACLTGELLSAMQPDQAAALSLIPVPGTRLWEDIQAGRFTLPDATAMLRELRLILEHTHVGRGLFLADHASNHLPLKLRLPRDRERGLALLDAAIAGKVNLRPESTRRL
jgi:radical SAM superfamily enzyme YgiQ (UPF0313 family)